MKWSLMFRCFADAPVTPSLKIYNQYKDDIGGTDVHGVEHSSLQVICSIINGETFCDLVNTAFTLTLMGFPATLSQCVWGK